MAYLVGLLTICFGFSVMATEGPFGKQVTGRSIGVGVDDCSSTKMLNRVVTESGINFVDGDYRETFGCEQLKAKDIYSNGGTLNDHCAQGKKVRCFTSGSNVTVCVANPRSVELKKTYGDTGRGIDHRGRFDAIYVFSKTASGYQSEKSWQMDSEGCQPTAANLNNPMPSEERCKSDIQDFSSGGNIHPPEISKEKFCDGKVTIEKLNAISRLNDCLEAYPQLIYMNRPQKSQKATAPAPGVEVEVQR